MEALEARPWVLIYLMTSSKFPLLSERSSSNRMDVDGSRGICLFKLKQTALIPAYILLISETKLRLQAKQITGPPESKTAERATLLRRDLMATLNFGFPDTVEAFSACLLLQRDGCDSCHTRVSCLGFRRLRG